MTSSASDHSFPAARVAMLSLVAGLLAATIWFGAQASASRAKVAALETERELAKTAAELAQSQLKERTLLAEESINDLGRKLEGRANPARRTAIRLRPTDQSATVGGIMLWYPAEKAGLLVVLGLPALGADQQYELRVSKPGADSSFKASFQNTANGVTLVDILPGSLPAFEADLITTVVAPAADTPRTVLSSK